MATAGTDIGDFGEDFVDDDVPMDWNIHISYADVEEAERKLKAGQTNLATLAGFSTEELEALYSKAWEFFASGMYIAAGRLFFALAMLKPGDARYYRGVGLCYHHRRLHRWARIIYGQALAYDPQDRISMALRAECTLVVIGKQAAKEELAAVLALGPRSKIDLPYLERAQALMNKLSVVARVG